MRIASALIISALLYAPAAQAQGFDIMQMADANGDGKLTPEEFAEFREHGWGFFADGAEKIKPADANPMAQRALSAVPLDAQGYVTHEAYTKIGPDLFKKADTDGNGSLSAEELQAAMGRPPRN
jgi:hypothetical protein